MATMGAPARSAAVSAREAVEDRFPKLLRCGYAITSPRADTYNCVAWIARDIQRWWEPDVDGLYWPADLGPGDGLADYIRLFERLGFESCATPALEDGEEKIAVYGANRAFEHVAFQREDGTWSSKLGELSDIRHDHLDSIAGNGPFEYSGVVFFMRRAREPHPLAETGLLLP